MDYFIRRFLLIIPTFLGITIVSFVIMQFVPGGPVERAILEFKMGAMAKGEAGGGAGQEGAAGEIPKEALEEMKRYYGFDRPVHARYLRWIYNLQPFKYDAAYYPYAALAEELGGFAARGTFEAPLARAALDRLKAAADENRWAVGALAAAQAADRPGVPSWDDRLTGAALLERAATLEASVAGAVATAEAAVAAGGPPRFGACLEALRAAAEAVSRQKGLIDAAAECFNRHLRDQALAEVATARPTAYLNIDFGKSYVYGEPVLQVIVSKFPVSIYFGLIGFTLSYLVCVPLGIWKAIRHGSAFDATSSMIVFVGYSIPGWALGVILLVVYGGGSYWNLFPLGGFQSPNFADLTVGGKILDRLHHTLLPVLCYMVGGFATLTVLMKNSLMENLGMDYVRTAFAKGLDERTVIFKHALRNSLIPIATGLGHALSLILAGSYLIEKVFNIDGFGYLGYTSIIMRDYPVAMGILVIGSLLSLLGNIFSDILYCLIDPRIRFS